MKFEDMKAGMYELTEDVQNPEPDRRKKREFRYLPVWTKGTRLVMESDPEFPSVFSIRPITGSAYCAMRARIDGKSTHKGFAALLAALQPVQSTTREFLNSQINNGNWVLEKLIDSGKITREDVQRIVDRDE